MRRLRTCAVCSRWFAHAQAYGAGNLAALGPIFQETCAFLAAHCIPLTALLLGAPRLLARLEGRDSALCGMAAAYSLRLLPCLWLEVLNRCAARPWLRLCLAGFMQVAFKCLSKAGKR